jgi:hypothetical protein
MPVCGEKAEGGERRGACVPSQIYGNNWEMALSTYARTERARRTFELSPRLARRNTVHSPHQS